MVQGIEPKLKQLQPKRKTIFQYRIRIIFFYKSSFQIAYNNGLSYILDSSKRCFKFVSDYRTKVEEDITQVQSFFQDRVHVILLLIKAHFKLHIKIIRARSDTPLKTASNFLQSIEPYCLKQKNPFYHQADIF